MPLFRYGTRVGHDYLGFEHFNESALISRDGWKIVRPGVKAEWELYNLNEDRSEKHNIADQYPEILARMMEAYDEWTRRCMVVPYPGQKK